MVEIPIPSKLPLLEGLCWNIANPYSLDPKTMLDIYQSRWNYQGVVGKANAEEINYIYQLTQTYKTPPLILEKMNQNKEQFFFTVETILNNINNQIFQEFNLLWCGGSLLAMNAEGYRLSLDIDFIANDFDYDLFYEWLLDHHPQELFTSNSIVTAGELRRDRIAIRIPVTVESTSIKLEIIAEERFILDTPPHTRNKVSQLVFIDRIVCKLFANRDRWIDDSSFCRDLIDLAVLRKQASFPEIVYTKGKRNYKIKESLVEALSRFSNQPQLRKKCYEVLQIDNPSIVIDGLDLLAADFKLSPIKREFSEIDFGYLDK